MRAGDLDRRIRIDRATLVPDAVGQGVPSWAPFSGDGKRWAKFDPRPGGERYAAQQLVAKNAVSFMVRYDSATATITASADFRIVFEGRNYDITDVMPSKERRESITFLCFARIDEAAA